MFVVIGYVTENEYIMQTYFFHFFALISLYFIAVLLSLYLLCGISFG